MTSLPHPDSVLASLLEGGCRASRRKGLEGLHKICRAQNESRGDFSLATIGRLCEAAGLFKWRILYNQGSRDYQTLIGAWSKFCGAPVRGAAARAPELESMRVLELIDDPAVRSIVQKVINDRNKLRAELNLLKAATLISMDMRPKGAPTSALAEPGSHALGNVWNITNSEREALKRAISKELFEAEGWGEGSHGEVFNALGRKLFDVGYTRAIKKVLGSA